MSCFGGFAFSAVGLIGLKSGFTCPMLLLQKM